MIDISAIDEEMADVVRCRSTQLCKDQRKEPRQTIICSLSVCPNHLNAVSQLQYRLVMRDCRLERFIQHNLVCTAAFTEDEWEELLVCLFFLFYLFPVP